MKLRKLTGIGLAFCAIMFVLFGAYLGVSLHTNAAMDDSFENETVSAAPQPDGSAYIQRVAQEGQKRSEMVHLGGHFAGFDLRLNGVMVLDFCEVETAAGKARLRGELQTGDIIRAIDGKKIVEIDDIKTALNSGEKRQTCMLRVSRGNADLDLSVSPLIEKVTEEYRLGILAKSDIAGIGTVTFTKQCGRFAALGHAIGGQFGAAPEIAGGTAYDCKLIGIEKGTRGRAGSVKGTISGATRLGTIDKNLNYGVYGSFDTPRGELYEVAKREEVRPGKAKIVCSVSGQREFYDIEILKTVYQHNESEKGMIVKVTDKRLIELTGGIVQGMSGSPIVQNNKLVGAVTHVFLKDPLRGYGMYMDWMIEK